MEFKKSWVLVLGACAGLGLGYLLWGRKSKTGNKNRLTPSVNVNESVSPKGSEANEAQQDAHIKMKTSPQEVAGKFSFECDDGNGNYVICTSDVKKACCNDKYGADASSWYPS